MSGICGLFNLDGEPAAEADVQDMASWLRRRGPDRIGASSDGPVSMGHAMLATTPEAVREPQPLVHTESGCTIAADVRLDYRSDLLSALGVQANDVGDAELVLRAYLRWGERCVEYLVGDFAFAIWDPSKRQLFCARDHFGLRPFYYFWEAGKRFIFASEARAILVLSSVPYEISLGRVADFLVPGLEWIDYTSTFFENVLRLPPGHSLTATPDGLDISEYWKPQPGPELNFRTDDEYRQGFLDVLSASIRSRMRAPEGAVGSMLSGGLDSGTIVAIARDIQHELGGGPLPTYSAIQTEETDCAESRAISAAQNMPLLSPTSICPGDLKGQYDSFVSGYDEPFDSEFTFLRAIYKTAQAAGQSVIFDGMGGDLVLAPGSYIVRLLRTGHLGLAWSEMKGEIKHWDSGSLVPQTLYYLRSAFLPHRVTRKLRRLLRKDSASAYLNASMISRDFASSVDLDRRWARYRQTFDLVETSDYAVELADLIRPNVTGGRERYGRIAAATAIEPRDPYLDKRVVEYCTRLPGRFRQRDGWYKVIQRDVMAGRLPDEVRWAVGKPHVGWHFSVAVTREAIERGSLTPHSLLDDLARFTDAQKLSDAWRTFEDGSDPMPLHSAHVLSIWLRENEDRPVVPNGPFG